MTNQVQGRKKSQFPANTAIPSGSYFDFTYNGVNYKVLDTTFYSNLGVTGTIVQQGDVTATPILNTQGTVNNIRNLETDSNSGLAFSVSVNGGVYCKLDAQSAGSGVPILDTDNTIRKLVAGSGISIAPTNGDIIISESGTPGTSNVVNVNSLNDFPTPVGSVITLADDTIYFINSLVDIATNTFAMGSKTVVLGLSASVVGITSSATGTLFASTGGKENEIGGLRITAPNCTIIGISSGLGTADVYAHGLDIISCAKIADVNGAFLFRFEECGVDLCSGDGFTFSGSNTLVNLHTCFVLGFTGTLFDLGTATFDRFNVDLCQFVSTSGSNVIIEGAASSANINASGLGDISEVFVSGSFTDSSTIFPSDTRWIFRDNNFAADSTVDALLSMQGNGTATTISVAGTPVLVAGTWVVEGNEKMTGTTAGRITYNAQNDISMPLTASVSVEPASGPVKTISAYYAVNGTFVANSKRQAAAASGTAASITMPWTETLSTGDYVEVFVANESDTTNVLVRSATFRAG